MNYYFVHMCITAHGPGIRTIGCNCSVTSENLKQLPDTSLQHNDVRAGKKDVIETE